MARKSDKPSSNRDKPGKGGHIEITIPSDFGASRVVQKKILAAVTRSGFGEQNIFAIKLALEEAMINAIKHGNKMDTKKHVYIAADVTPAKCEIVIEDEGPGFKRDGVPDPTLPENIEKCSGRGILLIEAYMNSVRYSNGGRRLKMVKKNQKATQAR